MFASAVRCKGRSAWKGPFFTSFPQLAAAQKAGLPRPGTGGTPPISTTSRSTTVLPNFVGLRMLVHNGKSYIPVNITPEMVGHKLGEFAPTRKPFSYRQTKNR
ncbi:ribosomal protein S19/S15 [Cystobasidium minutum MCA 4210]|uniref:mitochondrial 37S ribosomal protein uS19m n=1 Tax=Cystobasidium minutum MCA 4210 TaxID=1397322 RepID=UPI0034CFF614|eukprot:jgi/Rhomi1/213111/estExt_Genemark1.C_90067